jgi:thiol-disulfide isomerase/thioredoxin
MVAAILLYASLVNDVRSSLARHDLPGADRMVRTYEAQAGGTPEAAAAVSWLARGALDARDYARAQTYAAEARKLTVDLLRKRKLDSDPWLGVALGASIEVRAQAMAQSGEPGEAVTYLRHELANWGATSIGERIQKNLNLLSLEGKPAPPIAATDFLGTRPRPLSSLRGHPVLLFFWAHWCPDCKAEAPILAEIERTYGPRGLVLVAPTKLYGYAAGGAEASPAQEKVYIDQIRQHFYPMLAGVAIPVDGANFQTYGASTTPTLVLVDAQGIVRYYHPGAATKEELSARIQGVLPR